MLDETDETLVWNGRTYARLDVPGMRWYWIVDRALSLAVIDDFGQLVPVMQVK